MLTVHKKSIVVYTRVHVISARMKLSLFRKHVPFACTLCIQFVTLKWRVTRLTAIHPEEGRCIRPKYRWRIENIVFYSSFALFIYI